MWGVVELVVFLLVIVLGCYFFGLSRIREERVIIEFEVFTRKAVFLSWGFLVFFLKLNDWGVLRELFRDWRCFKE